MKMTSQEKQILKEGLYNIAIDEGVEQWAKTKIQDMCKTIKNFNPNLDDKTIGKIVKNSIFQLLNEITE